ncbi:uncharacterized protein LOC112602183 [Melanaphis sacchari]|uniref:uncharacterized protein LOC112602183 n=1 Tax=Melanaphis sacchari TaxID=742174 RepID=UPI000DC13C73|nr:uncharacterized protein LOC112602183 [Melanaphis sacchari]
MMKKSNSETFNKRQQNMDQSFELDTLSNDVEKSIVSSLIGVPELKAYVTTLKKHKQQISVMVENIIKTVNTSQEKKLTDVFVWEKTSGKPSKIEYGVPLIVEPKTIHDVDHTINDVFRDYLCRELPGNKKQLFNSLELREHLSLIEDIRCAEKDLMEVQERLLRVDNKDDWIELKPWNVKNYTLLCPRMFAFNAEKKKESVSSKKIVKKNVYGIYSEMRRLRLGLNKERRMLSLPHCVTKIKRTLPILDKTMNNGLSVNTNIVRFNRFISGGIYKKTVIIRNSGKRLIAFKLLTSNLSWFEYDYKPICPLAPGMNAKLTVTFKCMSMEDKFELIALMTDENKKINILIGAENESPILNYTLECYDDMKTTDCKKLALRNPSSACLFECNACLVGARKTVIVKIKNVGRSSKFILVPENVWYTKSVEDVEWKETISLGAFTITPSIFEINFEQTMELTVLFEPRLPSFYCTRFIIVSDNSCAQEVNVFGDGQMFGARSVRLSGPGLLSTQAEAESYVLDMGKIGEVVRYVYAKNMSRIKYPYRWIINHAIDNPGSKNAKVNFNIHPSTGLLDKFSKTMFRVECGVSNEIVNEQLTGKYRVTATMMIDDIPKESIDDQNIYYEEQEDNPESLSIEAAQIEVISEYNGKERISLYTDRIIIDLNWHQLRTDLCVKETVDFINNGSYPVHVSWIPSADNASASIEVEPKSFEVTDRAKISVHVEPLCPGPFRQMLRFVTKNRDCDTDETIVYVRGKVEQTPNVRVRPAIAPFDNICAGTLESYDVEFNVISDGPFTVQRYLYEFDTVGKLTLHGDVKLFGPYGNENTTYTTLNFKTPVEIEATGISCQLAKWSFTGSKTVHTQSVTYATFPDVRLNVNTITIAESLYKGIPHTHKGIQLLNNAHYDFVYSWGNPMGSDSDKIDCMFKPSSGTINGNANVEFEFIITPKKSGYLNKCHIPFFVQCNVLAPQKISLECRINEFSATVTYIDVYGAQYSITWKDNKKRWIINTEQNEINLLESKSNQTSITQYLNNSETENVEEYEIEPEDQKPTKWRFGEWPRRDTPLCSPLAVQFQQELNYYHPVMAFKDIKCNTAMEQSITIRKTTKIPCKIETKVRYHDYPTSDKIGNTYQDSIENATKKCCTIWIERDDKIGYRQDEFKISVWVLATTWGRYEDVVTIELHVGLDILPAIHIPLIINAITFPIEFPLAKDVHNPTIKFSLYSMESENRLQILNNSEISIKISWRMYNKSKENKPFGVLIDTLTPDHPDHWSFRITDYDGLENPRYFIIDPIILKLEPKTLGYVTFSLDRTKEISLNRDENNLVNGKAVGIITALEPAGKYCIRKDGFKMKPTIVQLYSETRHSIQPNLVIRELDNIFHVSASQMYNSRSQYYTETRLFTMCNHLRYPANISFEISSPFIIKSLKSLRCGNRSGKTNIYLFHQDLVEIELQATIDIQQVYVPKMPTKLLPRKIERIGYLSAVYENSYFKPKVVATFKIYIYFPVLKLSTNYINFGQVVVEETKSINVMLSSYSGAERFITKSVDTVFTVSPSEGVVSNRPIPLIISFKPKAHEQYLKKIEILTTIPMDVIFLEVSGLGIK